jgi:predicted Zn-dependent protease
MAQRQLGHAESVLNAALEPDAPAETTAQRLVWCTRADLALAMGCAERALEIAEKLSAARQKYPNARPIVHVSRLRGEALTALHRYAEAEVALKEASAIVHEIGGRPLLWRILLTLHRAYEGQGKQAEAQQAAGEARTILLELVAQTPEGNLREGLLAAASSLLPGQ